MNPLTEKPTPRKGLTAGGEIDAWCTRCRLDLGHRIIAMVSGRPKRVVCMTCGSEHNYRAPKSEERSASASAPRRAAGAGKPAAAKPKAASVARAEWESRVNGQAVAAFTRYSMDQTFRVDQLVTHKKFGEGYVSGVPSADKVTIVFRDGEKTLAQNKTD